MSLWNGNGMERKRNPPSRITTNYLFSARVAGEVMYLLVWILCVVFHPDFLLMRERFSVFMGEISFSISVENGDLFGYNFFVSMCLQSSTFKELNDRGGMTCFFGGFYVQVECGGTVVNF